MEECGQRYKATYLFKISAHNSHTFNTSCGTVDNQRISFHLEQLMQFNIISRKNVVLFDKRLHSFHFMGRLSYES